jgi:hypothetical protein
MEMRTNMEPTDDVKRVAEAIAKAEGSPPEWNNPGDLTYADGYPNRGPQNADGVLAFVNLSDGWNALYHQVELMLTGKSHVYAPTDTLEEVGRKYSNGDPNWAINVAEELGVPVTTTLQQLAIPPANPVADPEIGM